MPENIVVGHRVPCPALRECRRIPGMPVALYLLCPERPSSCLLSMPGCRDGNVSPLRSWLTGMLGFSSSLKKCSWPQGGIKSL